MKKLEITYDVWKTLVESNNWTAYHCSLGQNKCEIFSGTSDFQIRSLVQSDSYGMWNNDFPSSIEKENYDDVCVSIIQGEYNNLKKSANVYSSGQIVENTDKNYLLAGKDINSYAKQLLVDSYGKIILSDNNIVQKKEYDIRINEWDNTPIDIGPSEWVTVYENTNINSVFYGAIFQLNSNSILMKVITNGVNSFELSLSTLNDYYKIGYGNGKEHFEWPINEYFTKRWYFLPHTILITSSIIIQFKSISDNIRIEYGMSWWGTK